MTTIRNNFINMTKLQRFELQKLATNQFFTKKSLAMQKTKKNLKFSFMTEHALNFKHPHIGKSEIIFQKILNYRKLKLT